MIRLLPAALSLILAAPGSALADPEVREVGSAKLVVLADAEAEKVHGEFALHAGSLHEPADKKGVATVAARAMSADAAGWLAGRGGSLEASVDIDTMRFVFACAPGDVSGVLTRLGTGLSTAPSGDAVQAARQAAAAAATAYLDTATGKAMRAADHVTLGRFSAYRRVFLPTELAAITPSDVAAFQSAQVGADRLTAGLHGAVDADAAANELGQALSQLGDAGELPADPVPPIYTPWRTRLYLVDDPEATETEVHMLTLGPTRASKTVPALDAWIGATVVGSGAPARKFVIDKGFGTEVDMSLDLPWTRPGFLRAKVTAPNDTVHKAIENLINIMDARHSKPPREGELAAGRAYFEEEQARVAADPATSIARAVDLVLNGREATYWRDRAVLTQTAHPGTMRAALMRHLLLKQLTLVAVGPADQIRGELEYLADVEDVTFELPASDPEAKDAVDGMLTALGGRDAWANLTGIELMTETTTVFRGEERTRRHRLQRYFGSVHTALDQELEVQTTKTVIDGTPGFIDTNLGIRGVANSQYRQLVQKKRRWLFTILHRFATEDPTIYATMSDDGRVIVSDTLGEICWLTVGDNGRPERLFWHGTYDQELIYGGWAKSGGLVYPREISEAMYLGQPRETPSDVRRVVEFTPNPPFDPAAFDRAQAGS